MPVPNENKERRIVRSVDALKRLKVSAHALAVAPRITPMLKKADGGLKQVLLAMRLAQDEVISAFLRKYDTVPARDRVSLPIEAIALAAGVDINHLLGSTLIALQRQAQSLVKIIAVTSHPKITKARVVYGQMPFGERDRTALDQAMGFLPSPKGPTFIGKAIFGSGKNVMDQQGGERDDDSDDDDGPDLDKIFPSANTMQEKLVLIRQRMLPSSSS